MLVVSLAALAVAGCSNERSTGPRIDDLPSMDHTVATKPVFIVEPTLMMVPTYDGTGQAVHPDVVAFDSPWHGARYWLTMTPYARSDQTVENPSILMSDDGISVAEPAGLRNPVIKAPRKSRDYNSDPELIYDPRGDRLVLFHRLVEPKTNTVRVTTSRDGVTWTAARDPFWERNHQVVSPTVATRADGAARMWYVNAGKAGCDAKSTTVVTRIASDSLGGVVDTKWVGRKETDLRIPGYVIWHIKARWIPEKQEYWMLISAFPEKGNGCKTDDLFFARSADGTHWKAYEEPVLRHEEREWTAAAVYRSTFIYDAAQDELHLWISGRGMNGAWRIGFARARFSELLAALEDGRPLTARPSVLFSAPALGLGEQP